MNAQPVTLRRPGLWSLAELDAHLCEDSKTTTTARPNGRPRTANATWWPAVATCPGSSSACRADCYAVTIESYRHEARHAAERRRQDWNRELAAGNGAALAAALMRRSRDRQVDLGVTRPTFRVAASGDWWSAALVDAWREAAHQVDADDAERLTVWGYSRSYGAGRDYLRRLLDPDTGLPPPGWTYYLSSDPSMLRRTVNALRGDAYHALPVAMMAESADEGRRLLEKIRRLAGDGPRRALVCPVDADNMPRTVQVRGTYRGACSHCRACSPKHSTTAPDIIFPIH